MAAAYASPALYYDITVPIRDNMPGWPGDVEVQARRTSFIEKGGTANLTALTLSSHTGTHIDPPRHFLSDGKTVDQLDPSVFLGPCYVVDFSGLPVRDIGAADLENAAVPSGTERLLVRTANCAPTLDVWSSSHFRRDYVALTADGALWVKRRGIKLLGWDYLSVETFFADSYPVHHTLLGAGVVLLEGLDLRGLPAGNAMYTLFCLPLLIAGGDGAPARALLGGGQVSGH